MGHKTDKLGYKTDKKRKPTKLDTKVKTKMGHQQNQTLKLKLKWDTDQVETKTGHQPNET